MAHNYSYPIPTEQQQQQPLPLHPDPNRPIAQPQHGPPDFAYAYTHGYPLSVDHSTQQYYHPPTATSIPSAAPPIHLYPPPLPQIPDTRLRPPALTLDLSGTLPQDYDPSYPIVYSDPNQPLHSPYTPNGVPYAQPMGSASSQPQMNDYFPIYPDEPLQQVTADTAPLISPTWQSAPPVGGSSRPGPSTSGPSTRGKGGSNAKTSRQQFTACGACRHRRVKCDLKDRQDQAERTGGLVSPDEGVGAHRTSSAARRARVNCTNCEERGTNCVYVYLWHCKNPSHLTSAVTNSLLSRLSSSSAGVNGYQKSKCDTVKQQRALLLPLNPNKPQIPPSVHLPITQNPHQSYQS
jgi:hypothetical protein